MAFFHELVAAEPSRFKARKPLMQATAFVARAHKALAAPSFFGAGNAPGETITSEALCEQVADL